MAIPYRTRRRLKRLGSLFLALLVLAACAWLCWVIWVERYIIYTEDGAVIDFDLNPVIPMGEVAQPPVIGEGPEIHYNEGENAVNTSTDLLQMSGYYITYDLLKNDFDNVKAKVAHIILYALQNLGIRRRQGEEFGEQQALRSILLPCNLRHVLIVEHTQMCTMLVDNHQTGTGCRNDILPPVLEMLGPDLLVAKVSIRKQRFLPV